MLQLIRSRILKKYKAFLTSIQQRGISKHIRNRAFRRRQKDEKYMEKIIITFPDGNKREYGAGITAGEVAQTISISLSKKAISADLDGNHWDLQWPIYQDAELSINCLLYTSPSPRDRG